jgi:hypothetical protein
MSQAFPQPEPQPRARADSPAADSPAADSPAADGRAADGRAADWEAFYANYRKPGYVSGFEITSKLGGGMFGLVFKAVRQSIGKEYAIKFLKVDDGEVRRAVLQELDQVRYFAQVDHPNLVSIEDKGEVDGIPYLVMAFAGHETLKDKIAAAAERPAERDEALRCFLQACRGVAALHEHSLVHFDLKPANVFVKGGVARVGDYGLSKLVTHSRGSLSMGRGTPYYMAPEMLQRRGDQRSDVYSLGVVLYEVLTGRLPFTGDSEWEVLRKHETAKVEFPAGIGTRERAVIERCLAKDPAQRFASVHELLAALHAIFGADDASRAAEPPPLPAANETQARAQAAEFVATAWNAPPPRPRRARGGPLALALCIGVAAVALLSFRVRSREFAAANVAAAETPAASAARSLRDELRKLAEQVQRARRAPDLRAIDGARVHLPRDLDLYRDQVDQLRDAEFARTQGTRFEWLGQPMFIAAVQWLQEQDYHDADTCKHAAAVLQLLQQMTAVQALALPTPGDSIDAATVRRFAGAAEAWRQIAERYCADQDAYRRFLQATGKLRDPRKN